MRFKIDHSGSYSWPYALFRRTSTWWGGTYWERLDSFETHEKARERYEAIKDLPEYLP